MTTKFNLSNLRICDELGYSYDEDDVKEFIRRLKVPIILEIKEAEKNNTPSTQTARILLRRIIREIDKLAGDDLSGEWKWLIEINNWKILLSYLEF